MTCEHPHTTCDSCGEGLTAMGPPLRPSPDTDAGLDVDDLDSILLALGQLPTWFPETAAKVEAMKARLTSEKGQP